MILDDGKPLPDLKITMTEEEAKKRFPYHPMVQRKGKALENLLSDVVKASNKSG